MSALENQINQSCSDLKHANSFLVQSTLQHFSQSVFEMWNERSTLFIECEHTLPLFALRKQSFQIMKMLVAIQPQSVASNLVEYCGITMDFAIARNHAVTAYIMANWSIYDRLCNISGRLIGTADIGHNAKDNPKLVEDFFDKREKNKVPYILQHHFNASYRWPVMVSYKIRNWLAHEGYDIGNIPLFKGNRICDGFILHPEAMDTIQKNNDYKLSTDGRIQNSCIDPSNEFWHTNDLLQILESYHSVIDNMLASLLKWSTDAFVNHLKCFVPHP